MNPVLVEQQGQRAAFMLVSQQQQEPREVLGRLPSTGQKEPLAGQKVQAAEQDALGVDPGNQHLGLLAAPRPALTQQRKQAQHRLVLRKELGPRGQTRDLANQSTLFFRYSGSGTRR